MGKSIFKNRPEVSQWEGPSPRRWLYSTSLLVLVGALTPGGVHAQAVWTGTTSGNWFDASNWAVGGVPTNSDVHIGTVTPNFTAIANAGAEAQGLWVGINGGNGRLSIILNGTLDSHFGTIGTNAGEKGDIGLSGINTRWTNTDAIIVGSAGEGLFEIGNGATVHSGYDYLGYYAGGQGLAYVDGVGSTWTVDQTLTIGYGGHGGLTITNGGVVSSQSAILGASAGAEAVVNVSGLGSQMHTFGALAQGALVVGQGGTGRLTIAQGGTVTNAEGAVGSLAGSEGTVWVKDSGSSWATAGILRIGDAGKGTLNIQSGGIVTDASATLADRAGSQAHATVTGIGSRWIHSGPLQIGNAGVAELNILDRGLVQSITAGVGGEQGAEGTVAVSGAGSRWDNSGQLNVGYRGTGEVEAASGGVITSGYVNIAAETNSSGTVVVRGAFSSLKVTHELFVGFLGSGRLIAETGGTIESESAVIASRSGSSGIARVTGAGSTWTNTGNLTVGGQGNGALIVTGTGATVATGGFLTVGGDGHGSLTVTNGGSVSSVGGHVGRDAGGSGEALVDGIGSRWNTGGATVFVGTGTTGRLTVSYGAVVDGPVQVAANGTLAGDGTVGATDVIGGTLLGVQGRTLTIGGPLTLTPDARVNVTLGAAGNTTGLFNVTGNLVLDGTLNVAFTAGFGAGVYRIIDYAGALTDNGLIVGTMPSGTIGTVQTAVAHQVNLLVSGTVDEARFWNGTNTVADGTIHGGSGTWSATSTTNWTDVNGAIAAAWADTFAVFQNNPGVVTVDGSYGMVSAMGMQFIGTGWTVLGDSITLIGAGGSTTIRVGDGTPGGASHSATIGSELTGASGLVKDDFGTLILTGTNSYSGGTTIAAGTLQIGNGGTTGSIAGAVLNSGVLAFNRSDAYQFSGAISGSGLIRQMGSGIIGLTGNSAAFTGTTRVEAGTLAVDGVLGGALEILAGGRLQGIGTVGDTTVNGMIAPGHSIGTIKVGNITFNAGAIYEAEVNAAGQADRIDAGGTATINGGSVRVLAGAGSYAPQTQYTILTAAGGRSGTFTGGVTSNLAFLTPSLSYDANNVYLTMARNDIDFAGVGVTPNQIAAGGGVESLGLGNPVHNAVLNLAAEQARGAFDQLSGEIHASLRGAMIDDSRFVRHAVNDRIRAAFAAVGASGGHVVTYEDGKPRPAAATTDRLAVWGQGFGSFGHASGDGNAARLDRSIGGFFVGADAPLFNAWRFGVVAGYSRSSFRANARASSATSDTYHVGFYGGTAWGDLAFRAGAAYSWHDIATTRRVLFAGFGDSLKGSYGAATAQAFGEFGYRMRAGDVAFEPFANLAYVNLHVAGFGENGGSAALAAGAASSDTMFTTVGLRASTSFSFSTAAVTARGMLGWRHAFGDVRSGATMRFAGGGESFVIGGIPIARHAAVVEAGLDFAFSPTAMFGVSYGGQFGSGVIDQTFRANFNAKF
ncbi:Extracellular serine protease precursor [bacterium YEK0313]|nr:Extracellular serine protease precursor [bacterium YEK0313]